MIANPQIADRHEQVDGQDVYLYEFPAESLKDLIFGIRMPRDKRRQLRDIIKGKYQNVELFEAKLDPGKFDLETARFQF